TKPSRAKALRVAREISALDRASPEEIATISMPRKLYSPNDAARKAATHPLGAKLPLSRYWGCTWRLNSNTAPTKMNSKIVNTLMKANQYSTAPYLPTENRLSTSSNIPKTIIHDTIGTPGNQTRM